MYVLLAFVALICLTPMAFYLSWLAAVNKRDHPTIVSGTWDFARVYLALSGFLLLGGVLLTGLVVSDTRYLYRGNFEQLQNSWEIAHLAWVLVAVGYLALVIGAGVISVTNRRNQLSIYNIEIVDLEQAIELAINQAGLKPKRLGNLWFDGSGIIEMKPFNGANHATVTLLSPDLRIREEVQLHLRKALAGVGSSPGPAAPWLVSISFGLVLIEIGLVAFLLYGIFFRMNR